MRLKKLTLHGFKSFADRTELDFDAGITAIVGPNGCGKSNVVDAFKWVLGEQSAKSLRGRQMLDVIFNGSSGRKSSGMAEVALTFEAEGELCEQYGAEVVITRRLYRSGQSDYLVNNKPSRLKDIRELFMDTGCGVDAYSLIEQGKVDLLLQASNQERRAVLEEAAGISKYKARRKEAQRRLENVQQNLLRLGDIVSEVEKQLRSVKLQAGKARNYQQYVTQLNEMKSQYYLAEYHRLMEQQGHLRVELDEVNQDLRDSKIKQDLAESNRSELELQLVDYGNKISGIENQLTQTVGQITSATDNIDLLHQRIEEQGEILNQARRRLQTYHTQTEILQRQQKELESQLGEFTGEDQSFNLRIQELQKQLTEKTLDLTELTEEVEAEKSNLIELMRQIAQANNMINQTSIQHQNIISNRERLEARQTQLESQRSEIQTRRSGLQHEFEEVQESLTASENDLSQVQRQYEELHQQADQITKDLAHAREKRSAVRSRHDVLHDMEHKQQGLDKGVRTLLERKEEKPEEFAGILTLVADAIHTDLEHAKMIETALAGRDQCVVVDKAEFLERHCPLLTELPGQVNFFPMDLLAPVVNPRDYGHIDGVIGLATKFVRNDPAYDQLVHVLLGKTVLVRDLTTAMTLRRDDNAGMRFVTLDGELIESDGSVHIGVGKGGGGLISRKSELEALTAQLAELDEQINQLDQLSRQTNEQQRELAARQQQLRTKIYEFKTARVQLQTNLANCDEQFRKIAQEEPIIKSELDSLEQQENFAIEQQEQALEKVATLESQQSEAQYKLQAMQGQLQTRLVDKNKLAEQLTELKIQAGQLAEKRRAAVNAINSLKQRIQQIHASYETAVVEIQSAQTRIQQAERQILNLESRQAKAYLDKQELQAESAWLRQHRDAHQQTLQTLLDSTQDVRQRVETLQQRTQDLALKINELTVRQETLIQRVQEELQVDVEHAYGQYEYQERDWEAVEDEINELKGKIARLGNVNVDAIAEQEQLEAREVFLHSQQKDLIEAQEKLQDLIQKLDEESARRFKETFESVRANFQDLFRKIFGGGKADLVLDNPDDALESGIDILARPPGKETRSVSLLSGGEKTMTTVALLMAIFKSRPSPFCILDEVDAALDEANVDRFNLVIQEFLSHSQFIVISHNKRTMSYANVLYGITMQEAGISRRVAVKFDDKSGAPKPINKDDETEAA
ncbi:MAG: chromosome segregation protein SMC [Phycisphaerae bacterium]|nr:chromosome segregation protein SMC [Phycisphaerae bacterium]